MSKRQLALLAAVGATFGATFLLNEIALRGIGPTALVAARIVVGAVVVTGIACASPELRRSARSLRRLLLPLAVASVLNIGAPFFLIAWGQERISSGLAGILVSAAPIFTALLALAFDRRERVGGLRLAGFVIGFGGVVLLLARSPAGEGGAPLGAIAVLGAAFCYGAGALYAGRALRGVRPLLVAAGTLVFSAALTVPAGLAQLPAGVPGAGPLLATLALGVGTTGLAQVLYFRLIASAGASRAILVSYLVPTLAVVYGVTILDEPFTPIVVAGLVLVLAGVGLGTGRARRQPPLGARQPLDPIGAQVAQHDRMAADEQGPGDRLADSPARNERSSRPDH